jgi:hypothetical protein
MTNYTKNHSKRTTALAVVAGIALVLGTAGCKSEGAKQVSHGEQFIADDQARSVNKFADAQASSGARADSTLHACHFDGGQLNSLGRGKLRSMMKDDDACEPMAVFIDLKGTGEATARREAVTAFLLDEGLLESQIQLKEGPNPNSATPAVKALKALAASDSAAGATATGGAESKGSVPTATAK